LANKNHKYQHYGYTEGIGKESGSFILIFVFSCVVQCITLRQNKCIKSIFHFQQKGAAVGSRNHICHHGYNSVGINAMDCSQAGRKLHMGESRQGNCFTFKKDHGIFQIFNFTPKRFIKANNDIVFVFTNAMLGGLGTMQTKAPCLIHIRYDTKLWH